MFNKKIEIEKISRFFAGIGVVFAALAVIFGFLGLMYRGGCFSLQSSDSNS